MILNISKPQCFFKILSDTWGIDDVTCDTQILANNNNTG